MEVLDQTLRIKKVSFYLRSKCLSNLEIKSSLIYNYKDIYIKIFILVNICYIVFDIFNGPLH